MKLRPDAVGRLEKLIEETRERIDGDVRQREQHLGLVHDAERQLDQIVGLEAEGRLGADEAEQRFAESESVKGRHAASVRRITGVITRREEDLGKLEAERDRAIFGRVLTELAEAGERAAATSRKFGEHLRAAIALISKLAEERNAVDQAKARAGELRPADDDRPISHADEAPWLSYEHLSRLTGFLQAGPRPPGADLAERAKRAKQSEEERKRHEIVQYAQGRISLTLVDQAWRAEAEQARAAVVTRRPDGDHEPTSPFAIRAR